MVKSGQTSFRRILLSRLLLLSVPVLLVGEYITYRKARSSLLETARQNVTESAVRKGESIQTNIKALKANLITASQTSVLQSGSPEEAQKFLEQLTRELPNKIECLQLAEVTTGKTVVSTCGDRALKIPIPNLPRQKPNQLTSLSSININLIFDNEPNSQDKTRTSNHVDLGFTTPIYTGNGQLRYILKVESALYEQENIDQQTTNSNTGYKPGSLTGYTVIIDQDGKILAHRDSERIGRNINDEVDAARLKSIIRNALKGEKDFLHLSSFDKEKVELLTGYTAIPSALTSDKQQWIILAVTRLDYALAGLDEIKQIMFNLVLGLLAANLIATLLVAQDLARPIEQLGEYALNVQCTQTPDRIPYKFKIYEFNQLTEAIDSMIERLKSWAQELESAWQEAKVSNQLKNEFLATTSHELRTPLNAIIGCIRLVRDDCCDDREEEIDFLQKADDAAIHLLSIINDVLDIAKIEAGTLSVLRESVDLSQILNEVINLQTLAIQEKGLELHYHNLENAVIVQADRAKLKQVFLNVINNAIKFTDTGSINISSRIAPIEDMTSLNGNDNKNGNSQSETIISNSTETQETPDKKSISNLGVIVSIKDTGIGIHRNQQHKLFQPFVMVNGSTTRQHGGAGLGLAISRNLMEMMGGNITLISAGKNLGTTVEISLPIIYLPTSEDKADVQEEVNMEA